MVVTDPKAIENARHDLRDAGGSVAFESDPYAAAAGGGGSIYANAGG